MSNKGKYIAGCQLCRGHTFFETLESIPSPFVCGCLQKPADKDTWKVCQTCFRGTWITKNLFRKFECPFCKVEDVRSRKYQIKIMPPTYPSSINRPRESINWNEITKHKKEKEEAKRRQERIELAELIADKLAKKNPEPEIMVHELGDK